MVFENATETIGSMGSSLFLALQILIILFIIVAIIFLVVIILQYNVRFRVRELTGGKTRIIDDRAKLVKDKTGVLKWRLLKRRHYVPVPPAEAIHLTKKGKYAVEAYFTPENEYKYIIDEGIDRGTLVGFKPLTTIDREFYANEVSKALKYKRKKFLDLLVPLAFVGSLTILIICVFVFWQDLYEPVKEQGQHNKQMMGEIAKITESQAEITKTLGDIYLNKQTVKAKDAG